MRRALLVVVLAALSASANAQVPNEPRITVLVTAGANPVAGAQVRAGAARGRTDASGRVTLRVDTGRVVVQVTRLGYQPRSDTVVVLLIPDTVRVELEPLEESLERVVVATTRTERQVELEPVRVEIVDRDEVEEKAVMTPGDVAMLLNETSGVRVQTTSPALGGANVRVLGLRGRYTQVLADGLPLFGGQMSGLGLLQIPPLDLERVEIIKGAASALYGPSALGGVVNLISRAPADEREWSFLLNGTSRGGVDFTGWTSGPLADTWGQSLLVGLHGQELHDANEDAWADIPRFNRVVARPRLHYDGGSGRSLYITAGVVTEERAGGCIQIPRRCGSAPFDTFPPAWYRESVETQRADIGSIGRLLVGDKTLLVSRVAHTEQRHTHRFGDWRERDRHSTSLAEISATGRSQGAAWVTGVAWQRDTYLARDVGGFDYRFSVPAAFAQVERDIGPFVALSGSARYDRHSRYGSSVSPRFSVLARLPAEWTVRTALGSGVFSPTPFTEETESASGLRVLDSASFAALRQERSTSATMDAAGSLGTWHVNLSLHLTRIRHAVLWRVLDDSARRPTGLYNARAPSVTSGLEANLRRRQGALTLVASYVLLRAREEDPDDGSSRRDVPLTPRQAGGLDAMWELEGMGRLGFEVFYVGRQSLDDNPYRRTSRPYALYGVLVERQFGALKVFVNSENLGDVRQTRFDPLLRAAPDRAGRLTVDAWAPLEGRIFNAGARIAIP